MLVSFTLLVICFISLVFYKRAPKDSGQFTNLEKFRGPRKSSFVRTEWTFTNAEKRLSTIVRLQREFGNRVYMTVTGRKFMMLFHPEDVGKILASKEMNKSSLYNLILSDWLGKSSFFYAKAKEHLRKRKMILSAFDAKRVDDFEETLNANAKSLVKCLKASEAKGQVIQIQELFRLCSLDMAFQYLVGKETRSLDNQDNGFALAVHNETKYVSQRASSLWLWPVILWKLSPTGRKEKLNRQVLHDTIDKIIEESKGNKSFVQQTMADSNFMENNGKVENDKKEKLKLLHHLIRKQEEKEPGVTDTYIRDAINASLFGAHDTVTSALTFAMYLLATHPEDQIKVQKELVEVLGSELDGNIQMCDLGKLKYLECCIKEVLRLYPSAPYMARRSDTDFQLDKDVLIPKGVDIVISAWVTHRLAEFFPEPDKFMPWRFSPENSIGRHPYCYFPFSGGPRNCIGQKIAMDKMKMILAHICYNFTVELPPGAETMEPIGDMVLTPKNELHIKLTSR